MSGKTTVQIAPEKTSQPSRVMTSGSGGPLRTWLGNPFVGLQQTVGNQAMLRLLKSGTIQTKLRVSQPGDEDEKKADSVAEQVVSAKHAPKIQRKCACEGSGEPCAQCEEEQAGTIHRSVTSPILRTSELGIQRAPGPDAPAMDVPEKTEDPAKTSPGGAKGYSFIVDDDAKKIEPYQMRKSQFIALLRTDACSAADAVLASVGHSTNGCPYIEKWLGFYEKQSAEHIASAIRKYAPEAAAARSADEAIQLIVTRVRKAALTWAKTGKIEGAPKEVTAQQPDKGGSLDKHHTLASTMLAEAIVSFRGGKSKQEGSSSSGGVWRKARNGETAPAHDAAAVKSQLGTGQSLDSRVQSQMSSAFGHNFSGVRVHTDSSAAKLSSDLNARAFAIGSDVAFAAGEYNPGTLVGDALIAHELTHVIQQRGGGNQVAMRANNDGTNDDQFENEADHSAFQVVSSLWGNSKAIAAGMTTRAMPTLQSGLRLQRCNCDRSKEVKPTAPLKDVLPAFTCSPSPASLDDIKKMPGVPSGVLGITQPTTPHPHPTIHPAADSSCTLEISPMPQFGLDHCLYTRPGTYDLGTTTPAPAKSATEKHYPDDWW